MFLNLVHSAPDRRWSRALMIVCLFILSYVNSPLDNAIAGIMIASARMLFGDIYSELNDHEVRQLHRPRQQRLLEQDETTEHSALLWLMRLRKHEEHQQDPTMIGKRHPERDESRKTIGDEVETAEDEFFDMQQAQGHTDFDSQNIGDDRFDEADYEYDEHSRYVEFEEPEPQDFWIEGVGGEDQFEYDTWGEHENEDYTILDGEEEEEEEYIQAYDKLYAANVLSELRDDDVAHRDEKYNQDGNYDMSFKYAKSSEALGEMRNQDDSLAEQSNQLQREVIAETSWNLQHRTSDAENRDPVIHGLQEYERPKNLYDRGDIQLQNGPLARKTS